jgi:hypothetical protein
MGSIAELSLGGVSAELGGIKGGNNCLIIYSSKMSLFFRKVGCKNGRGAGRPGATSPERSDERATIGLRYILLRIFLPNN